MTQITVSDLVFTAVDGSPLPLSRFAGQVLLLVNTASQCGFTRQYAGLQKLHEQYRERGFSVIGLPCNDFGAQEPGCGLEIKQFAEEEFQVTFPLTDKVHAKGENTHPLFARIAEQFGVFGSPHWNFYKYVAGRDGKLKTWFSPLSGPEASSLHKVIEAELQRPA